MAKIRIGIVGYGNIGKGVETALSQNPDMELTAVFTRRPIQNIKVKTKGVKVINVSDAKRYVGQIDVMILCGGSAMDLPEQGPHFAQMFNTVDSFDTHAKVSEYYEAVNEKALNSGKTCIISVGWDPGLFSIIRMLSGAILPAGKDYTFWGKGVSQGHSDAIRRVNGVKGAVQYTVPVDSSIEMVRKGENPDLSVMDKHTRECFVVAEEEADKTQIEADIINMPNYFSEYNTVVHFITDEELKKNHSKMPHGGFVFRSGTTGNMNNHIMEFAIKLESNPEFTGNILVAYARAAYKLHGEGAKGAKTVFDVPVSYLSANNIHDLIKNLL